MTWHCLWVCGAVWKFHRGLERCSSLICGVVVVSQFRTQKSCKTLPSHNQREVVHGWRETGVKRNSLYWKEKPLQRWFIFLALQNQMCGDPHKCVTFQLSTGHGIPNLVFKTLMIFCHLCYYYYYYYLVWNAQSPTFFFKYTYLQLIYQSPDYKMCLVVCATAEYCDGTCDRTLTLPSRASRQTSPAEFCG